MLFWWSHIGQTLVAKPTNSACVYVACIRVWPLIGGCNWVSCSDSSWLRGQRYTFARARTRAESQTGLQLMMAIMSTQSWGQWEKMGGKRDEMEKRGKQRQKEFNDLLLYLKASLPQTFYLSRQKRTQEMGDEITNEFFETTSDILRDTKTWVNPLMIIDFEKCLL